MTGNNQTPFKKLTVVNGGRTHWEFWYYDGAFYNYRFGQSEAFKSFDHASEPNPSTEQKTSWRKTTNEHWGYNAEPQFPQDGGLTLL